MYSDPYNRLDCWFSFFQFIKLRFVLLCYVFVLGVIFWFLTIIILVSFLIFIRPPNIICRRTYVLPRILPFFFISYLRSLLNGTQPKLATCSEVSVIWKRMFEIWGILSPTNRGPQNLCWRFYNLMAMLTAYIFPTKHDIDIWVSALTTTMGILHHPKQHELRSTNCLKLDCHFHPLSVDSAFYFIARLRTRGSANGTQPEFGKRWTVNRAYILP